MERVGSQEQAKMSTDPRSDVVIVVTEARQGGNRVVLTSEIKQFPEELISSPPRPNSGQSK
jgi:hypothetical protein